MAPASIVQGVIYNAANYARVPSKTITITIGPTEIGEVTDSQGRYFATIPSGTPAEAKPTLTEPASALDPMIEESTTAKLINGCAAAVCRIHNQAGYLSGSCILNGSMYSGSYSFDGLQGNWSRYKNSSGETIRIYNSFTHLGYVRFIDSLHVANSWTDSSAPGMAKKQVWSFKQGTGDTLQMLN